MRIDVYPRKVQEGEKPIWKLEAMDLVRAEVLQSSEWQNATYINVMSDDELKQAVKTSSSHLLAASYALALVRRMIAMDELAEILSAEESLPA